LRPGNQNRLIVVDPSSDFTLLASQRRDRVAGKIRDPNIRSVEGYAVHRNVRTGKVPRTLPSNALTLVTQMFAPSKAIVSGLLPTVTVLHPEQFLAMLGLGDEKPDFTLRLKSPDCRSSTWP
jgi:hypothetical protein